MARYFGLTPFSRDSFCHDLWDFPEPRRIFDQRFGVGLPLLSDDDFFSRQSLPTTFFRGHYVRPRREYNRQQSGCSDVQTTKDCFKVALDINHFSPNEVSVKTVDNYVVIRGKHEEKADEHGFVSREFTRRYLLPDGVDPATVTSSLSRDGCLTIEAPRELPETPQSNERVVPVSVRGATEATMDVEADSKEDE